MAASPRLGFEQPPTPRRVILDSDGGQDDALALLLALAAPEIEVVAVTCVHGNVDVDQAAWNLRAVCELAGRPDIPVHRGCPRPILRPPRRADKVHGPTGIDDWTPPAPCMPLADKPAVPALIDAVMGGAPGEIALVTIGPLTNVALALTQEPALAARLGVIAMMGGAVRCGGNSRPLAEWNMLVDPHAAAAVFGAGARLVQFPLDVTHQALTTPERLAALARLGGELGPALEAMLTHYGRFDSQRYGIAGAPLHDACPVAWLIEEEMFAGREMNVEIELVSDLSLGATVGDPWGMTGRPANCHVMERLDSARLYACLLARLARLPSAGEARAP